MVHWVVMRRTLLWMCLSGLVVACASRAVTPSSAPHKIGPMPGALAPNASFVNHQGETVEIGEMQGDVVLLNFWATWCGPCVEEMPSLQALHERFEPKGLRIAAVSVDQTSDVGFKFARDQQLTMEILHDPGAKGAAVFQVRSIPLTFLIDRAGKVTSRVRGAGDWESAEMISLVQRALDGES